MEKITVICDKCAKKRKMTQKSYGAIKRNDRRNWCKSCSHEGLFRKRDAKIVGKVAYIPLGKDAKYGYAKVSAEDAGLDAYCWRMGKLGTPEAYTKGSQKNRRKVYMHHLVVGSPPKGMVVDHINRNKLDNRRSNLRITTYSVNAINCHRKSSRYPHRGIRPSHSGKNWWAYLTYQKKQIFLGSYDTPDEAGLAYNRGALKYFGDVAILNKVHVKG